MKTMLIFFSIFFINNSLYRETTNLKTQLLLHKDKNISMLVITERMYHSEFIVILIEYCIVMLCFIRKKCNELLAKCLESAYTEIFQFRILCCHFLSEQSTLLRIRPIFPFGVFWSSEMSSSASSNAN